MCDERRLCFAVALKVAMSIAMNMLQVGMGMLQVGMGMLQVGMGV